MRLAGYVLLIMLLPVTSQAAKIPAHEPEPPAMSSRQHAAAQQATAAVQGANRNHKSGLMSRLGYELALAHAEFQAFRAISDRGQFRASNKQLRVHQDTVLIDAVAADDVLALKTALMGLGMKHVAVYGRYVSGYLPIKNLPRATALTTLRFARASLATRNAGAVTTQGDTAQASDIVRTNYAVDGSGVVIGTLSDSYNCKNGAASDVSQGELPPGVVLLQDEAGCASGSDEGRAMMQIVHDVAPGASLAFYSAFNGVADFANGILALHSTAGANIINDDVIYYLEPMFQDGPIAQAIDTVKAAGVAYFSAAGNSASKSYEAVFRNSGVKGYTPQSNHHDFDAGSSTDSLMQITIPANSQVIFVLQWDDPFFSVSGAPGADTDMDIILYPMSGPAIAGGIEDNIGGDAVELFAYTNSSSAAVSYQLAIDHVSGPEPGKIKFVYFGSMTVNEFATNSGTAYGHAMAAGARAVGAARYTQTPAYGVSPPVIESFSSKGGIKTLFDSAGNAVDITRQKPEFVAPDGGDTSFFGADYEGNGWPNFFGTSAAAPHAAGAAALINAHLPLLTVDELYTALQATALDMAGAGVDIRTGYGLIQVDSALLYYDSDGDGVQNAQDNCPLLANADQLDTDLDAAGNVCDADDDNDGLADVDEAGYQTNPLLPDSDGDGLSDGDEVYVYASNPVLADTDSDGIDDGAEIAANTDPNNPQSPLQANGDVNGDGSVDARDLLLLQRLVLGDIVVEPGYLQRGDVAPLSSGLPSPDNELNAADYWVLQKRILGEISF